MIEEPDLEPRQVDPESHHRVATVSSHHVYYVHFSDGSWCRAVAAVLVTAEPGPPAAPVVGLPETGCWAGTCCPRGYAHWPRRPGQRVPGEKGTSTSQVGGRSQLVGGSAGPEEAWRAPWVFVISLTARVSREMHVKSFFLGKNEKFCAGPVPSEGSHGLELRAPHRAGCRRPGPRLCCQTRRSERTPSAPGRAPGQRVGAGSPSRAETWPPG